MDIDKRILESIENQSRNTFIVGPGGCGKSHIIKHLKSIRDDILVVAPSGVASQNIEGRTIQSVFGITPRQYTGDESYKKNRVGQESLYEIERCNILLIDEVSMLRCEILDIVDYKLKKLKNNNLQFGGMKVILLGDPCQMEPVVQENENILLNKHYPYNENDYGFYNAHVMKEDGYFDTTFDIFKLTKDYRHKDDVQFRDILSNVRKGEISQKELNTLNSRYVEKLYYQQGIQYLTNTNSKAESINKIFSDKIKKPSYYSTAYIVKTYENYTDNLENIKNPFKKMLYLKEGMRVIFVKNDSKENGRRWVNGSFGIIKKINLLTNSMIRSVSVKVNENVYEVFREEYDLNVFVKEEGTFINVGTIEQFPFIPAYAITIDKSQGLTLDKIAVVMEKKHRDNQIYVALSRACSLNDVVIFGRRLEKRDIKLSIVMKSFLEYIEKKAITIDAYNSINNEINISGNNCGSISVNIINKISA
jgi:ATP-dependent exoDNAse (exonuclease V) alpha subunit